LEIFELNLGLIFKRNSPGEELANPEEVSFNEKTMDRLSDIDIGSLFNSAQLSNPNIKRNKLCGHRELPKFGATDTSSKLGGLVLLASSHAGKPYFRDNRLDTFNLSLHVDSRRILDKSNTLTIVINSGKASSCVSLFVR